MKKRCFLAALLALTLCFSAACSLGQDGSSTPTGSTPNASTPAGDSTGGGSASDDSADDSTGDDSTGDVTPTQECTVTFDTDGGNPVPESVTVKMGEKLTEPTAPQKSSSSCEYDFLGWYVGDKEWNFSVDVVTEDITLMAKWKVTEGYTSPFLPKD